MNNFWIKKKVVITGAAGFIGSHIVDALVTRGAEVTAIISPTTTQDQLKRNLGLSKKKISIKRVDLLDKKATIAATRDQEFILNFAALDGGISFKQKYPALIFKTNTDIVTNILDAAVMNKVKKVLLMSSIEVYPKMVKTPIKEAYSLKENFQEEATGYTWSKRFAEIAAKMYVKEYGLQIAIVRAGNVYGPRDYFASEKGRVIPVFIEKKLKNMPIQLVNGGSQRKQFLYVEDFVDAALQVTEEYAVCDPVNVAGREVVTIKELSVLIGQLIKNNKTTFSHTTQPSSRIISIAKLEQKTHFQQKISLIEGLKRTIQTVIYK